MKVNTYEFDTDAIRRAFERRGLPFHEVRRESKLLSVTLRRLLNPSDKPPDMSKERARRAAAYTIYSLARALHVDPRELAPDVPLPPPREKTQEELTTYYREGDKPTFARSRKRRNFKRNRDDELIEKAS